MTTKILKWINAYFGNAYERYSVFFSWFVIMACNNACNTDKTDKSFYCNLWFYVLACLNRL